MLSAEKEISDLFDQTVKCGAAAKKASNFIMSGVMRSVKENGGEISVSAKQIAEILALVEEGKISVSAAKNVLLPQIRSENDDISALIEKLGIVQIDDVVALQRLVDEVLEQNRKAVADYASGNKKVLSFLIGSVMKAAKGKFSPESVSKTIIKKLEKE